MCLGNYEFGVVPKLLFSVDGQSLAYSDKSKLIHLIEELAYSILPTHFSQRTWRFLYNN